MELLGRIAIPFCCLAVVVGFAASAASAAASATKTLTLPGCATVELIYVAHCANIPPIFHGETNGLERQSQKVEWNANVAKKE